MNHFTYTPTVLPTLTGILEIYLINIFTNTSEILTEN